MACIHCHDACQSHSSLQYKGSRQKFFMKLACPRSPERYRGGEDQGLQRRPAAGTQDADTISGSMQRLH